MDLAKYSDLEDKMNEGIWIEKVYDADNETVSENTRIKICGRDSKIYQKKLKVYQNKARKKKGGRFDVDEESAILDDAMEACVLEWEGFDNDKKPMKCTPDNIKLVFKVCPWIKDQVTEAVLDRSNFL